MILPIGHQERSVRRLPWVTISLIACCLVVFLFTDTESTPGPSATERFEEAADYWRQRAYLNAQPDIREHVAYDVMPNQRSQYLATLPNLSPFGPEEDGGLDAQQAELDRLTDLALGLAVDDSVAQSDFERWGLVPSSLRARSFVTHMFVHAGWLHLLGNLFMLLLAGPPIEDRWGRAAFAACYLLAGLFAAAFYLGFTNDPSVPMVGASGAIAGVLGAFLVRLWSTQIRFAYFFMFGLRPVWGTFEAPAWAMLSLWFANEVFQALLWDAVGLSGGVAYWAHVGGFAFGVGAAFAVRGLRIEQRFIDPAVDAKMTLFRANPVLEQAMAARESGDVDGALALLKTEWARHHDDEIALAFWDAALASAQPEAAAPALLAAVRSAAQRGDHELALRHWSELSDHAPGARPDPATLMRFVPVLLAENQRERAALALRQAVHPDNAPLSPGQALRIFELARELDPAAAARAARRALESADLHEAKRAKLQAWIDERAAAAALEPDPETASGAEPPEAAREPRPDWRADRVIDVARFARAKLLSARPRGLDADGIQLIVDGERVARLAWSRIQAVAVAIVADLAPKPVLLIDLLANWNAGEAEELRGIRLRSDQFDARALLASDADPRRAFASLVGRLLEASRAQPLPSAAQALGNPFARYASLADYERSVLEVA